MKADDINLESIFSPMLNTYPFTSYDKPIKKMNNYCTIMTSIFDGLNKNIRDIKDLMTRLTQKLFDFTENIKKISFQELKISKSMSQYNVDYSPLFLKFEENMLIWRWFKRKVDQPAEGAVRPRLRKPDIGDQGTL